MYVHDIGVGWPGPNQLIEGIEHRISVVCIQTCLRVDSPSLRFRHGFRRSPGPRGIGGPIDAICPSRQKGSRPGYPIECQRGGQGHLLVSATFSITRDRHRWLTTPEVASRFGIGMLHDHVNVLLG